MERSLSGTIFEYLGTMAAAGRSNSTRSYGFVDTKLLAGAGRLYYHLKQVDADGTFSYSPVFMVALKGAAEALALFPNPARGAATLLGTAVTVYDALGRAVASATADASGTTALVLPAGLPTGVYVVRAGSRAVRFTGDRSALRTWLSSPRALRRGLLRPPRRKPAGAKNNLFIRYCALGWAVTLWSCVLLSASFQLVLGLLE